MVEPAGGARSRLEVYAQVTCAACFALFCANVLYGWLAGSMGWDATWRLERAPEFMLLLASAVSFAVAALAAERRALADEARESPSG
jgi:TRAP-type C4-dicarboxylate transport system permease small subunit